MDEPNFQVPLDGFSMRLRRVEVEPVVAGLDALEGRPVDDSAALATGLRQLPVADRAPTWELTVRHYALRRPLPEVAGQIGLDESRARLLLAAYLAALPAR